MNEIGSQDNLAVQVWLLRAMSCSGAMGGAGRKLQGFRVWL